MKFWHKILRITDSLVNFAMVLCFLPILLYGAYALWDSGQIYKQADGASYQTYKPVSDEREPFAALQAANPEVFGWLMIDGTGIDYPLVQASTNAKYVNTDVSGGFSLSGSIFLDCRNDPSFSDVNSVIYGHNLQNDGMFGCLGQFQNKDYFEAHQSGMLFHSDRWHKIEFFAFVTADAYDPVLFNTELSGSEDREYYLAYVREQAQLFRPLSFHPEDHYIALSTCSNSTTNGRHILIGRIGENRA